MARYSITNPPTKTMQRGDIVVFTIRGLDYEYTVRGNHLSCERYDNNKVFELLDLDPHAFAEKTYGYAPPASSCWPAFRGGDFKAATRIVWHLFGVIACGGDACKPVKLSSEDYTDGKIKVYTEDGDGGEVGVWLEDHEHRAICIAVVTTEGRGDGRAFLKLVEDEDSREYCDRVVFDGDKIEFQP